MKNFKKINNLETSKVTKEQLYQLNGGLKMIACTSGSRSVCHIDGSDEGDCVLK
jgi:hypothetical protein